MLEVFEFDPKDYLETYYSGKPESDFGEDAVLYWFHRSYSDFSPKGKFLEFGGGPTLYSLISAAKHVDQIDFSDLLLTNIDEIKLWKDGIGHNWSEYIRRTLEFEAAIVDESTILQRANLIRQKLINFYTFDQRKSCVRPNEYDVVSVQFVPDSSTDNIQDFLECTNNIIHYLKEDGLLFMGVLKRTEGYSIGSKEIPSVFLTEESFERYLQILGIKILRMNSITTYDSKRGIGGYIVIVGKKEENFAPDISNYSFLN